MKNSRAGRLLLVGVGALIGVVVGAVMTDAAGSNGSSSFVPITPCRLMDTRGGGSTIGPRNTPINAGETYAALVWGTNGNCTIPTSAIAVSLNVTAVSPTAQGYVTVYPPDKSLPITSNLNFVAGQKPAPNAVTSPLSSADGRLGFYNSAGTVNLIADIVGYYEKAGAAPGGIVAGNCGAILRWDLPECKKGTFPTGTTPRGIAFDGTNIWVANRGADTVSRINPATGAKTDFPTGDGPFWIAFDGSNLWITNFNSGTVSKMNPSTGARVDIPTGAGAYGVAFDGTSVWVANYTADTVSKINPTTNVAATVPATVSQPFGVAFDGTYIWVTNNDTATVSKIDPVTGDDVLTPATGSEPRDIVFDGTYLWIANWASNSVSRMNPANGTRTDFTVGTNPFGVAFDGSKIWVANLNSHSVVKIDPATGSVVVSSASVVFPNDIAFDGSNIWVTNESANTVTKVVI